MGSWQIGENNVITIPDYPFDPTRGGTHEVRIEEYVYIDHSDFRMQDSEDYYGLGKSVWMYLCCRVLMMSRALDRGECVWLFGALYLIVNLLCSSR